MNLEVPKSNRNDMVRDRFFFCGRCCSKWNPIAFRLLGKKHMKFWRNICVKIYDHFYSTYPANDYLKKNELNHVADFAEQNTTQKRKRHSVIHLNTYILVMLQKDEYKFWEVK